MEVQSKKKQYLLGLRSGIPIVFGFIPVGIAYAIMARQAGLSVLQTCLISVCVFAGASQMMAAGMYAQGASVAAIVLTTFILNLRHIIMSLCVAKRMEKCPAWLKVVAGFGVTDETFAFFSTEKNSTVWFLLGLITVSYLSWNIGTFAGAIASDFLPEMVTASLGIALYAMFIALLVPDLTGNLRLLALVVLTALCNSLLTRFMDSSAALIISTLLCAFLGVFFVDLKEEGIERD